MFMVFVHIVEITHSNLSSRSLLLFLLRKPKRILCSCHILLCPQLFGHERVSVLDEGLRRWKFHWFPTVSGEPHTPGATNFTASFNPHLLRTYEQMLDNHTSRHEQVTFVGLR